MPSFQSKSVMVFEKQLNEDPANICDWFVDNKLSIHFGEDKTKSILFASKHKINSYQKFQQTFRKTSTGQNAFSFIGPALWNKVPEEIKRTNLNAFKHSLMKHYLKELGKSNFKEKLSLLISLVWLRFYIVTNITIIIIVVIVILLFIISITVNTTTRAVS